MPRVYLLASDSEPGTLLSTLNSALPRDRFLVSIGGTDSLDWREPLTAVRTATHIVGFAPHVLHAIGPTATRCAAVLLGIPRLGLSPFTRLIVTDPGSPKSDWLTWRAIRRAEFVGVSCQERADQLAREGVPTNWMAVIPPGFDDHAFTPLDANAFRELLNIPTNAPLLTLAGRFDRGGKLADSVFAFDVLKYACHGWYAVFVGTGPERRRAEEFARRVGFDDYRVRFAEASADPRAVMDQSELVWIPESTAAVPMTLHAMAAAKPVIATRTPDLAALVKDGISGQLVPVGDRIAFAEVTFRWLQDRPQMLRFAEAGRVRLREKFPASRVVARYSALYDDGTHATIRDAS